MRWRSYQPNKSGPAARRRRSYQPKWSRVHEMEELSTKPKRSGAHEMEGLSTKVVVPHPPENFWSQFRYGLLFSLRMWYRCVIFGPLLNRIHFSS
ncbi:hypothetical protein SLA2020_150890 [Shorea laevis]